MAGRHTSRERVIAGMFLIVAVVLAVLTCAVISGAVQFLTPSTPYAVRFALTDGANGLKPGSMVKLGGMEVGRVTGVRIATQEHADGDVPAAVEVRIRVRADLVLYENAWAFLEAPLLGTMSAINIASPGTPDAPAPHQGRGPRLERGEHLAGRIAPPSFLAAAGYGPEESGILKSILRDANQTARNLASLTDRFDAQAGPVLDDARLATQSAREILAEVRPRIGAWSDRVEGTLRGAEEASAMLPGIADSAREGLDEARAFVASLQDATDRNRPKLDAIFDRGESLALKLDTETVPLLQETLASARDGADSFSVLGERAGTLLAREDPTIRRTLANARLASDQLKFASAEIRRKPWLLFYQPGKKELESEVLYSAVHDYAAAVSDLRVASESIESLAAGDEQRPLDRVSLEEMMEQLRATFAAYQRAEQRLLDLLVSRESP